MATGNIGNNNQSVLQRLYGAVTGSGATGDAAPDAADVAAAGAAGADARKKKGSKTAPFQTRKSVGKRMEAASPNLKALNKALGEQ